LLACGAEKINSGGSRPGQSTPDIVLVLRQAPANLRSRVRRIGLFGSYARGEQRADSGIDLLVDFEADQKTYDNFIDLVFLLRRLVGPCGRCHHTRGAQSVHRPARDERHQIRVASQQKRRPATPGATIFTAPSS
jgi:predicted nucleotidyltransferase